MSVSDVTARKEAEAEREQLVLELQTALAAVKQLQSILRRHRDLIRF